VNVESDTAEARAARPYPYLTATVDRDGTFRIDDVPTGKYALTVYFLRDRARRLRNHRFEVPSTVGDSEAKPVDLGMLRLEKR